MFSIITVTYNSLSTLKDAYMSLVNQDFIHWEWVVQDGGSFDGTIEWLESLSDTRIKWVSNRDNGIYDALNKALCRASGDWIGLLHSDDIYPNNSVLKNVFECSEGKDAIYGDLKYVQAGDLTKVIRYWKAGVYDSKKLRRGWMPPHPTLFLRKDLYERVGLFDCKFKIAADYDFVLRVFQITGLKVEYLPEVLMLMRQGGASSKISNLIVKSLEDLQILKKNRMPFYYIVLFRKIAGKIQQFMLK